MKAPCVCFNRHPPLGVNATARKRAKKALRVSVFQWAPTLGGECYMNIYFPQLGVALVVFQWAPTLGGECYRV